MTIHAPIDEAAPARLFRHWRSLWPLAWPVVLSRAGLVVMQLVGVVIVGRYGTDALAAFSIGSAIAAPLMVAGFGCVVGIVALTSRAFGARDPDLPANALRGLAWATLIGLIATGLTLFAGPVLRLIGQEPELVRGGTTVAWMLAPGVLAQIVFSAASFYLEGTARPQPGLVAMAAANVLHIALAWPLVGGHLGFPELGAAGAALASTVARFLMAALFVVWLLRLPEFDGHRAAHGVWGPGGWAAGAEMRRIGMAGGAAYFFETIGFATLAQAAGLLGATALAAYTILHNVETVVFMLGLGISVATAVRVGHAAGAGDRAEARAAGIAGVAASMGLVGLLGLIILAFAPRVVGFYSSDPALIARAAPLLAILAVSMLFDAGQVVLGQANRALGDSWMTTLCFFLAFWCVMIPTGLLLAFHFGLAEAGLFIGTATGCIAAVVFLGLRFRQLLARI